MTVRIAVLGLLAAVLAGCATWPSASPGSGAQAPSSVFNDKAECQSNGGLWRPALNFCEVGGPNGG